MLPQYYLSIHQQKFAVTIWHFSSCFAFLDGFKEVCKIVKEMSVVSANLVKGYASLHYWEVTRGWQLIDKQSPNIIKPSRYTYLPLEQGKAVAVDKNCFVGGASEEKRTVSIQGEMNYEDNFFFHCSVRAAKLASPYQRWFIVDWIFPAKWWFTFLEKSLWKINQRKAAAVHLATL